MQCYMFTGHIHKLYTAVVCAGIIIDGWDHPVNLVPIVVMLVCFMFGGLPRGPLSVWVLINAAFIHLYMDG